MKAASSSSNGRSSGMNLGLSLLTGAAGVAGGVLLGRTAKQQGRKVLGMQVPEKVDFSSLSQSIGEAGRQFGRLASEVRSAREKAEQIGRILG